MKLGEPRRWLHPAFKPQDFFSPVRVPRATAGDDEIRASDGATSFASRRFFRKETELHNLAHELRQGELHGSSAAVRSVKHSSETRNARSEHDEQQRHGKRLSDIHLCKSLSKNLSDHNFRKPRGKSNVQRHFYSTSGLLLGDRVHQNNCQIYPKMSSMPSAFTSREPGRAFFSQDMTASLKTRASPRGLRNYIPDSRTLEMYSHDHLQSMPDIAYMQKIRRSDQPPPRHKVIDRKFMLPKNPELATDEYAGKMWTLSHSNKITRDAGILVSMGLITRPDEIPTKKVTSSDNRPGWNVSVSNAAWKTDIDNLNNGSGRRKRRAGTGKRRNVKREENNTGVSHSMRKLPHREMIQIGHAWVCSKIYELLHNTDESTSDSMMQCRLPLPVSSINACNVLQQYLDDAQMSPLRSSMESGHPIAQARPIDVNTPRYDEAYCIHVSHLRCRDENGFTRCSIVKLWIEKDFALGTLCPRVQYISPLRSLCATEHLLQAKSVAIVCCLHGISL